MKGYRLGTLSVILLIVTTLLHTFAAGDVPPTGLAGSAPFSLSVYTVTSTADAGPGTLRQALLDAASGDTILFSAMTFPPANPVTITLSSALPPITHDNLTLDASNAGVILDGSAAGGVSTPGLDIRANGVTVRGLHIVNFTGCGIELRGQHNTVGGDRQTGNGPLGEGNLISGNGICGIGMWEATTAYNVIRGNLIGVDASGLQAWGNQGDGIHINSANHNTIEENVIGGNASAIQGCCNTDSSYNVIRDNRIGVGSDGQSPIPNTMFGVWFHDGASHNTVGPGNVIAHNPFGVQVDTAASTGNTITGNSIYSNTEQGIRLDDGGNGNLAAPFLMAFNLAEGSVWGRACARCSVEIFSDLGDQGAVYEGQTTADATGLFVFARGAPLTGPHLTATATDMAGNTSAFSSPTSGSGVEWIIQEGNYRFISSLEPRRSEELADNHIGSGAGALWTLGDLYAWFDQEIATSGVTRFKLSVQEGEEPIDWTKPELSIEPYYDAWITDIVSHGLTLTYYLNFWDKANHPDGWTGITSRFKTVEDVQRFQEFVQFIVPHFCGRVPYFEIWSEPDNAASPVQYIEPQDYISVTHTLIPIIRSACPQAKIVVGSTSYLKNPDAYQYMLTVVQSDLMPLVDVVAWHSMFGTSPAYPDHADYYYAYPAIVQYLKDEAIAHGFDGEFRGDEIIWRSPDCSWCAPEDPLYTNSTAAKYYARGIVINLGMDLDVNPTGMSSLRRESFTVLRNLSTVFAGAEVAAFPIQVQTTMTQVASYTFALPDERHLLAVWNDGSATDEDPGISSTLRLPGFAGQIAVGIDPLHSLMQSLVTEDEGQTLVIHNLRVKDYPLLVRLSPVRMVYLPLVIRQ